MINTFDTDKNFWTTHPDMKVIQPFKELYISDSSKKKEQSSLLMWFVILCYDRESKFYKLSADGLEGKHAIVGEDYCNDINFYSKNKLILDAAIGMYINLQYTPMEKQMSALEEILAKRTRYLREAEYDIDTALELDKIVTGTYKVWQDYRKILEEMGKEDSSGVAKGGAQVSLLD